MSQIALLLDGAPPGADRALHAFSLAECLTDHVARPIYESVAVKGLTFDDFVSALKYSNIYEPRNSEWNIASTAKQELNERAPLSLEERHSIHKMLLAAAVKGDPSKAGQETPHYLFSDAGLAYHKAALGQVESALEHYSRCSLGEFRGTQWLAARFAGQQEREGVIPEGSVETRFLRAMVLFKTGLRREAIQLFREVAASPAKKREVAIALHITANEDARKRQFDAAEAAYLRSIEIGEDLNLKFHVLQAEHSLANLYARTKRPEPAEAAYMRSIGIGEEMKQAHAVAMVRHSLANFYVGQRRFEDAEDEYEESRDGLRITRDLFGLAQVEHSLANMYAQLGRNREASDSYLESIKIGESIDRRLHLAQVYRSYGLFLAKRDPAEAERLLSKSLQLNRRLRNRQGIAIVTRSLKKLRERSVRGGSDEAPVEAAVEWPQEAAPEWDSLGEADEVTESSVPQRYDESGEPA